MLLGLNGLRVSQACATDVEDLGFGRGHRTLKILGKDNKLATIPLVPRTARTIDLAVGVPLRDVQIAAHHADPRTTTICDRRRQNFDRHAACVVVAFVAGG
ncbi:MAG: hypothetical protein WD649_06290 [Thermoleophilaceae bacterium]